MIDSCMLIDCMEKVLRTEPIKCYLEKYARKEIGKFEEAIFPYFNATLLKMLYVDGFCFNDLVCIGEGRPNSEIRDKVDCLFTLRNGYKAAIEIKGPRLETDDLLFGKNTEKDKKIQIDENLEKCLRKIKSKSVLLDGKIADIIKLIRLIENGLIYEGYSIAILSKAKGKECDYVCKLNKAIECIKCHYSPKGFAIKCEKPRWIDDDLNACISVTRIWKNDCCS